MTKTKALTTKDTKPGDLARLNDVMKQAGQAANQAAARHVFAEHTARKADNTIRRKRADLATFEDFLQSTNVPARDLFDNPQAWQGMAWGIVEAFKKWMLGEGYAIASINGKLSTVRTFAKLAAKAGALDGQEYQLIKGVEGYAHGEADNVDDTRRESGIPTRKGYKKAEAVHIPDDIAQAMTTAPDKPSQQDRRDTLLMCLLLDHGLRVGEAAILTRESFDLKNNTLTFKRPKVKKTKKSIQKHALTPATREAWKAYARLAPDAGIIWRKSNKGKAKLSGQMSETSATRALTKRVELLGRGHGLESLSAHDCRHYWATYESRNGTPIERLKDAGGWASYAMPDRYIEAAHIANEGTAKVKA